MAARDGPSTDDRNNAYSGFLALPTELRCHIYDFVLADSHVITISAGFVTVLGHRIQDLARKTEIPGLPLELAPLVRLQHDPSLLSVADPPTVPIDGQLHSTEAGQSIYPAPLALLRTCRLVKDELTDYKRGKERIARARSAKQATPKENNEDDNEGLSLYVSYPYGVLVLKSQYPFLLKQARRVYIAGYYASPNDAEPGSPVSTEASDEEEQAQRLTPSNSFTIAESFGTPAPVRSFDRRNSSRSVRARSAEDSATQQPERAGRPRLRLDAPLSHQQRRLSNLASVFPSFSPVTAHLAPKALAHLVRTLLPSERTQLTKFSARILYPGENSYTSVWSDDRSPITHVLRNVCGGKIEMQVKRGNLGTGLCLTAVPNPEARVVSTSWENWWVSVPARNGGTRRIMGRMGFKDLDQFLTGEVTQ